MGVGWEMCTCNASTEELGRGESEVLGQRKSHSIPCSKNEHPEQNKERVRRKERKQ